MNDGTTSGTMPASSPQRRGRRGRTIPKAATPLTPGPITSDEVARAFKAARISLPEQSELDRLSTTFTVYKQYFLDAQRQRDLNDLANTAGNAVRTLAKALPQLLDYQKSRAEMGDPFADWQASAISKLLGAVETSDLPRIEAQSNVPNVIRDWRWLVHVIRPVIAPAMPTIQGTAKNGPASRFLAAIMPSMTGEEPSADAIATQIAHAKRDKFSTGEK